MSDDGRYVVFRCMCDGTGDFHAYRKDMVAGSNERLAVRVNGTFSNGQELVDSPQSLTPDGSTVVYTSWATNLSPEDTNDVSDLYVQRL